jgi:UDPglucose 6-dehydrogenase
VVKNKTRLLSNICKSRFKKNTNDFRESPAIDTCNQMLQAGLKLKLYDPRVNFSEFSKALLPSPAGLYTHAVSVIEAMQGAAAIFILTEWDEFKSIDWQAAAKAAQPKSGIFDGRATIDVAAAKAAGFTVYSVGKSN